MRRVATLLLVAGRRPGRPGVRPGARQSPAGPMRRVATLLLGAVGLPALLVFGTGAGKSDSGYEVRAVFDNAAYIVKGEDVKVAGAVVGSVKSLDVTDDKRAVIVLTITKP